jgi:isopentenyl diphosphate isomerase/L-lactate dehydrogenase-like FMN-dependent dehydrogenase
MNTRKLYSIEAYRQRARKRLPRMVFDFIDGGALDEHTLRRNRESLDSVMLTQRILVDVAHVDTSVRLLDIDLKLPILVSPMGILTALHPDADPAVAKSAAAAGSVFIHSAWSGCSLEETCRSADGHVWAQISLWKDTSETRRHVSNASELGIDTLIVAGDVALNSKRERDIQHGASMPPRPPLADMIDTALHPGWMWRWLTGRRLTYGNLQIDGQPLRIRHMEPWMAANQNPRADWDTFSELRRQWPGKLLIKGVMSAADAAIAVAKGADGIFVSNHGGRQFDSQPATIEALPRIADQVNGRVPIIIDGGIRRGSDIVKAIALGATAASAGRPFAFALAAGGQAGVRHAFDIFQDELATAMGFLGRTRVDDLDTSVLINRRFGAEVMPLEPVDSVDTPPTPLSVDGRAEGPCPPPSLTPT